MPVSFTADEKDRLFDTLDAIQLDVRKLREGRIRDLNRLAGVEKQIAEMKAAPIARRDRVHAYLISLACGSGGGLLLGLAAHLKG